MNILVLNCYHHFNLFVLRVEAFQWGIGVMMRAVPTEDTRIIACVNVAGFVFRCFHNRVHVRVTCARLVCVRLSRWSLFVAWMFRY